ncbi:zinc finger protein 678-like [Aplysia californica]|uniref:Zinc finger protein 678-like n=1 Tax=Aplysia californica TaxID=6500 RepID=A0ABM0JU13_APLCA|nr:zinc finger protein 678-like [Aplysia californica]
MADISYTSKQMDANCEEDTTITMYRLNSGNDNGSGCVKTCDLFVPCSSGEGVNLGIDSIVVKGEHISRSRPRSSSTSTLCTNSLNLREDVKHDIISRESESVGVDEEHLSVKEEPSFECLCDAKAETNDKLNVESESSQTLRHSVVKDEPICTEEEDVKPVIKPECLTDICTVKTEPLFGHFPDFGDEVKSKVENFVNEEVSEWEGPDFGEVGKTEGQVGDVEDTCTEPVFVEDHMSQAGGLQLQISNVRSLCMEQSASPDTDVVASSSPTSTFSADPVTSSGSVVRTSWDHGESSGKHLNGSSKHESYVKSRMSCDSKQSMGQGPDFNLSCAVSFASCINSTEASSTTPPKVYKEMGAGCQDVPRSLVRESRYSGEQPHKCIVYLEMFTELGDLQRHKRTYTIDRPCKCEVCGVTFTCSSSLQKHKRIHTRKKRHTCEVCGATFTRGGNLESHKRIHTGEKPYKCEVCGATFTFNSGLLSHIRTHTGEKPYKCEVCGAAFTRGSSLQSHKRTHTGEKPYKCEVCGATFTCNSSLRKHKRIHTGEKPYKCEDCGATFTQGSNLQSHKRTHTGEKPYKCEDCGATFTHGSSLQIHKRTHTGEKPYKCEDCGATFSTRSNLLGHKRTHTGERPYKCEDCGAAFSTSSNLLGHKRTHTGEKPYKCEVCGATFTFKGGLQSHTRTHTGEKPYKCEVCGATFMFSNGLQRHREIHAGEKSDMSSPESRTVVTAISPESRTVVTAIAPEVGLKYNQITNFPL